MKIGTFWCWLWGHKFLLVEKTKVMKYIGRTKVIQTNFCVRCGIDKPKN